MSKHTKGKVVIKKSNLYISSAIVALILIIGAAFLLLRPTDKTTSATVSLLSPASYLEDVRTNNHILIDVRTPEEFASGYIEGAINIPVDDLARRLAEIPDDMPVVVYCRSGNRSQRAASILQNAGFNDGIYDLGGVIQWTADGYTLIQ